MKFVLIAAWFTAAEPPVPFQVEFITMEACEKAIGQLSLSWSRTDLKWKLMATCVPR